MERKQRRRRTPWRDNVEAISMAVVMALLLKYFIVEAYKIPTGSMQPTLIGDDHSGIKDRILVDKLSYVFGDPERWEVAVFRYPLDRSKNFVKRVVGVGPEDFRIRSGDLWHRADASEEWRPLRRPREVQRSMWKRLDAEHPEESSWGWSPGATPVAEWSIAGRTIAARGHGEVEFRPGPESIVDEYLDGYPEPIRALLPPSHLGSGSNEVGDLRVEGSVHALPGLDSLEIELTEGQRQYRFRLPGPAAPADAKAEVAVRSFADFDPPYLAVAVSEDPLRLPAERAVRLAAQNLDDLLELELDGEVVLSLEVDPAVDQASGVTLRVRGEGADLDDLMVLRDVFYLASGQSNVTIPAGHYYMLGDNTQDSSDSREWTFARFKAWRPDGEEVLHRGNARRGENPRTVGYGDPEGPRTSLRNEWGELLWFGPETASPQPPEQAPFVPRDMIQGKALAVFWPLNPRLGVYRLKWVH